MTCDQEMCPNWAGDGNVCICALFDLDREGFYEEDEPVEDVIAAFEKGTSQ